MQLHQFAVSGFAYKLTPAQRESLLKILVNMAAVDHDISVEEERFLIEWATEWHLSLDLTPDEVEDDVVLLSAFDSFDAKVIALQEMVKLSYQDGHFGDEEREKVQQFSIRLGIHNANVLNGINRWVRRWYDWHYEGQQMLEPDTWMNMARGT
ncbi:MAG: TerB family tellurite resistance protein [Gammaproteobacteria bacterium]|nr:TerB family tellurite resistance protein [Gammaproteobacteria bacterium]